jgi:hypothetical protein
MIILMMYEKNVQGNQQVTIIVVPSHKKNEKNDTSDDILDANVDASTSQMPKKNLYTRSIE